MKIWLFLLVAVCCTKFSAGQQITKILFLDEKGRVPDIKTAKKFIVMKKYPDGIFQRLNYKKAGPLESMQTYGDSTLSFLEGRFYSYNSNGRLEFTGNYQQNKKHGTWYYYDDTFHIVKREIYNAGELTRTITSDKELFEQITEQYLLPKITDPETDEPGIPTEGAAASFGKKKGAWGKYVSGELNPDVFSRSGSAGGDVLICFMVNKEGKTGNIFLRKSVEYTLDEEAIRVIRKSPDWTAGHKNGKKVDYYFQQKITFIK